MTSAGRSAGRPPVMTDVAELAGVSHQTVSRALNGLPHVRPRTRDLVHAAISQLGYRPNAAARALVTRRTRTLGVISFDTTLFGPAAMLHGIERAAQAHPRPRARSSHRASSSGQAREESRVHPRGR